MEIIPNLEITSENNSEYKLVHQFTLYKNPIAEGSVSTVFLAIDKATSILYAAKAVRLTVQDEFHKFFSQFIDNYEQLKGASSSFISTHDCVCTSFTSIYYFSKLSNYGSLESYISKAGTLNEALIKHLFLPVAKGIQEMHTKNIVHRDVNPSHILLHLCKGNSFEVKLCGLLCSINLDKHGICNQSVGKIKFNAPEVKRSAVDRCEYGKPCDIWSYGMCILYCLLNDNFNDNSWEDLESYQISPELNNLLTRCLNIDYRFRISIQDIINHPFFSDNHLLDLSYLNLEDRDPQLEIPARATYHPYIIENSKLGNGAYGKVMRCRLISNQNVIYAMKKIDTRNKNEKELQQFKREIELMVILRNKPFVVNLIDYFYIKQDLHLVMEYCNGGNLFDHINQLINSRRFIYMYEEIKRIAWNVAEALSFMHQKNILHRDIKPPNILLVKDFTGAIIDAKVCDFGLSRKTNLQCKSILGTFGYMPPEIVNNSSNISKVCYTNKADIWCYGGILFFMTFGIEVFTFAKNSGQILYQTGITQFPPCNHVEVTLIDLIKKCLSLQPENRPSASEILKHPFFNSIEFEPLLSLPFPLYPLSNESKSPIELFTDTNGLFKVQVIKESFFSSHPHSYYKMINNLCNLLKMKGCPYLVKLKRNFIFKRDYYLVLENHNGGDLETYFKFRKTITISELKLVGRCVIECLAFLHERNIVHRGIYQNNIFLNIDVIHSRQILHAIVGDFGFSRMMELIENDNSRNSWEFLSPEISEGIAHREEVDIFSYGSLLNYLLNKCENYDENNEDFKELKILISTCQDKSGIKRPSAKNILNSRFFQHLNK